jgi:hypothetical protein
MYVNAMATVANVAPAFGPATAALSLVVPVKLEAQTTSVQATAGPLAPRETEPEPGFTFFPLWFGNLFHGPFRQIGWLFGLLLVLLMLALVVLRSRVRATKLRIRRRAALPAFHRFRIR